MTKRRETFSTQPDITQLMSQYDTIVRKQANQRLTEIIESYEDYWVDDALPYFELMTTIDTAAAFLDIPQARGRTKEILQDMTKQLQEAYDQLKTSRAAISRYPLPLWLRQLHLFYIEAISEFVTRGEWVPLHTLTKHAGLKKIREALRKADPIDIGGNIGYRAKLHPLLAAVRSEKPGIGNERTVKIALAQLKAKREADDELQLWEEEAIEGMILAIDNKKCGDLVRDCRRKYRNSPKNG